MPACAGQSKMSGSVRGGGKGKGIGGNRRTCVCPCGHILRGVRQRLGTELRLHQKVCETCAGTNLSSFINKKEEHQNLTDLKGGSQYRQAGNKRDCSGGMMSKSKATAYNSETGDSKLIDVDGSGSNIVEKVGDLAELVNVVEKLTECGGLGTRGETVQEVVINGQNAIKIDGDIGIEEVREALSALGYEAEVFGEKESKTQKKRRMRKNKKEREFNASIGLGEKTDAELNPFELDFKIKKYCE
tara:strand:- start:2509 stop:3240 length:732 start_codon:yes stop_codon:yes gene_type:complete